MREQEIAEAIEEALQGTQLEITIKPGAIEGLPSFIVMVHSEVLIALDEHHLVLMTVADSREWGEDSWRTFRVVLIDKSSRTWLIAWMTHNLERIQVVR